MPPRGDFGQPGAIVRIRLRNFMTYNDISMRPGTNLNMVIGPNGSGKSAIVCSIIVGLAGDVTLTGRATNIVDLVQRGCKWGSTEIELSNDKGRNWVVERKIILTGRTQGKVDYKNEWRLNGSLVPKKNIQELMTKLNIKVDNLCQFLPQDSVANFVKMNSGELLNETLNAAGCHQLVEDLEKLTQLTEDINTGERQLEALKQSSDEHEVNARRLETEVQELRARDDMIKKKVHCSLKIHYVRYQEELTKSDEAQDALKDKEDALRQAESDAEPFQDKVRQYKAEEVKLLDQVRSGSDDSRRAEDLVRQCKEAIERRKTECQDKYKDFKLIKENEQQRDLQIRMKQQELDSYECRLTEIRDVDHGKELEAIRTRIESIRGEMMHNRRDQDGVNNELRNLVRQHQDLSAKQHELLRIKETKLSMLKNKKKDAGNVCDWLAMNTDKFEQHVFLPMMTEINVKNQKDAPIIEHVMNEADFYSFVCQSDRDLRKLTDVARRTLHARINVVIPPERAPEEAHRHDYSRFSGFRCYIKDLIDAPEPIMRYLCGQYKFHTIPVFTDLPEADMKRLMDSGCPRFYVRDKCFQVSRSRYDQSINTLSSMIGQRPRILLYSLDKRQLDELNRQLEIMTQKRNSLNKKLDDLRKDISDKENDFRESQKRQTDLLQKQGEKERIQTLIMVSRQQIDELKTSVIDLEAESAKFNDAIKTINNRIVGDLERLSKTIDTFAKIRETYCLNLLKCTLARRNHRMAQKNYEDATKLAKELKERLRSDRNQLQILLKKVEDAKKVAEEKIKGFKNDRLDKSTKRKFAEIDKDTVEELELYEEELKIRIQGLSRDAGNQVLEEFQRQTREIRDKRQQMIHLGESLKKQKEDMKLISDRFMPELDDVIKVIDEHYRDFMRKLNYDGRVRLGRDEARKEDFSKYGIDIMVKYRDEEELIPLSGTRQSGGERSVATMIYMLALQTKTTVPFRVVDEINQGMDKDNERKVFELLVGVADESSSQYFLVSPKLLSGLDYGQRMQIHIVFNGPQLNYCFDELRTDSDGADESPESDTSSEIYFDTQ